ncbi:hypothetical protein L2E82_50388 [Cichorium intybus]|nr:hypothetical protein L2E82_50388 [Cichorium intybus]
MEKPITPKMNVFQLMESKESVPHAESAKNEESKIKSEMPYPSMLFLSFKDKNKTQITPKPVVMSNELYDSKWYMDSGCSIHMTGKKEYLRDYRNLDDAGNVRFGNNETCPIRGYGKITNGQFTISRVAFVEGLKHNLVSISQLVVGTGNVVTFNNQGSVITKEATKEVLLKSKMKGSMFPLNLKPVTSGQSLCLLSKANSDVSWLWHRRLAHLNFKDLNKLVAMDLVRGMPALKFDNDSLCSACEHGKQTKQRHPTVINPKITEPLSLLCMDLCGLSAVESIGKKKYILVIVDDYSRFTWVLFLRNKSDAAEKIINFIKKMELMLNKKVRTVHSDNGSEFKNHTLDGFLKTKRISHNFSAPYTPQQNGVVERRICSLCEAARTMLNFANLPMMLRIRIMSASLRRLVGHAVAEVSAMAAEASSQNTEAMSIPNLKSQSSNLVLRNDLSLYPKPIDALVQCMKRSVLGYALTCTPSVPATLVHRAHYTSNALFDSNNQVKSVFYETVDSKSKTKKV